MKNKFIYVLLLALPLLFFLQNIRQDYFYYSDDWDHFALVYNNSFADLFKQTMLSADGVWVHHKIITGFFLFKLLYEIFGTPPQVYLIAVFILNTANIFAFYSLVQTILQNRRISFFLALIFASFYLSWISNIHELITAFFVLLGLFSWHKWLFERKKLQYLFSLIFYLCAMLSKEIAFLLPVALLFVTFGHDFKRARQVLKSLYPFIFVMVLYGIFYASGFINYFSYEAQSSYHMSVSTQIIKNLVIYFSLTFRGLSANLFWIVAFIVGSLVRDIKAKGKKVTPFVASYFLFLVPPLFFANKISDYYVYIPLIFLLIGLGIWLNKSRIINRTQWSFIFTLCLITFGVFNVYKEIKDGIYLSIHPRTSNTKIVFAKVVNNVSRFMAADHIAAESLVSIGTRERDEGIQFAIDRGALPAFIDNPKMEDYIFTYIDGDILIQKINYE